MYNRFPCYGVMICFRGRKNHREKKLKQKADVRLWESCIGFTDLTEVLKI